jgi:raffinose/stachyose/melibiose transport system substrate-binding protein
MYCSPTAFIDSNVVYYNKDIFDNAGVSAPNTWDEFLGLCDALLAKGIQPIAFPGAAIWENSWPTFTFMALWATDALTNITKGTGTWLDPTIEKAFTMTQLMCEKGYYGKDYMSITDQNAQLMFTNGNAAMFIDGTWDNSVYSSSGINLRSFYIPDEKGVRIGQMSVSNYMTYSVASSSKYPDAAIAFVNFLASPEAHQIMENHTKMICAMDDVTPPDKSILFEDMKNFDHLGAQMHQVAVTCNSDNVKANDLLMKQIITQLTAFEITPKQACEMMDEASTYPQP